MENRGASEVKNVWLAVGIPGHPEGVEGQGSVQASQTWETCHVEMRNRLLQTVAAQLEAHCWLKYRML